MFSVSSLSCEKIDWFVCSNNASNWSSSPGFSRHSGHPCIRTHIEYPSQQRASDVWPISWSSHHIGHPDNINQGDVLLVAHRPFLIALTIPISIYCFCPGRWWDEQHSPCWRKKAEEAGEGEGTMKTSSSKREQIDSDRLSPSFSRTIIWRCYRRARDRGCEQSAGERSTDARATKTKHKSEGKKTTVTANHASMMYNNNRTPFSFSLSPLSLSLSLSISLVHICRSWP